MQGVRTWTSVVNPCATNIGILLVNDVPDILAMLLDLVGHHYVPDAGADGEDFELTR
jgi:hypothetical protein